MRPVCVISDFARGHFIMCANETFKCTIKWQAFLCEKKVGPVASVASANRRLCCALLKTDSVA